MQQQDNINKLTAHLFRQQSGKMTAVLSRVFGLHNIDTITDAVQDSFEAALHKWRFGEVPGNPQGWLLQVAKNKTINALKKNNKTVLADPSIYLDCSSLLSEHQFTDLLLEHEIADSQLRLLYTCCHPPFPDKTQIVITLHIVCGFGVPEIANALMMREEAVKKTISRGKAALKELGNLLNTNVTTRSAQRTEVVLTVIYLMFNEGYKTTRAAHAINKQLCFEAVRLALLLAPVGAEGASDAHALLALMFFSLSRFEARISAVGEWLPIGEQDRSLWDKTLIAEAYSHLNLATKGSCVSRYHVEAIIASVHCAARSFQDTDWQALLSLYNTLEEIAPSPMVALNKLVVKSYLPGYSEALTDLETLGKMPCFRNSFLIPATRADILSRKGQTKAAADEYLQALCLAVSPADRQFFKKQLLTCTQTKTS